MGVIIAIACITLALCLYDFFSSRGWGQITSSGRNEAVFEQRNRKYGAYAIRRLYNRVITIIMLVTMLACAGSIFAKKKFGSGGEPLKKDAILSDTTLLLVSAPPVEHIETIPASYELSDPVKEEETAPEESDPEPEKAPEKQEITSNSTAASPSQSRENPSKKSQSKTSSAEQKVKDFERDLFENAEGVKERERIRKEMEERKRQREQQAAQKGQAGQNAQRSSPPSTGKEQPMVKWTLEGRTPHQNDPWFVRNPGYTCENRAGGTVKVAIKVNSNGDVTSARIVNSNTSNTCIEEKALEYAKKSRFNPSSASSQDGTIEYIFSPR